MLIVAGCALVLFWLLAVFIFKVTKGLIHVVLIIALVAIAMHFMRAR
ncbi:MAG: DUF5670 family protein [Gemmatimonadaceae bacterium]